MLVLNKGRLYAKSIGSRTRIERSKVYKIWGRRMWDRVCEFGKENRKGHAAKLYQVFRSCLILRSYL